MENELISSNSQIHKFKKEITLLKVGTKEWFINDSKTRFYTGLPNLKVLNALFEYIADEIPHYQGNGLCKFEKMTLMLMRMRLNLTLMDLAYRFNVCCSTASSVVLNLTSLAVSGPKIAKVGTN